MGLRTKQSSKQKKIHWLGKMFFFQMFNIPRLQGNITYNYFETSSYSKDNGQDTENKCPQMLACICEKRNNCSLPLGI